MIDSIKKCAAISLLLCALAACTSDGRVTRRDVGTGVGAAGGAIIGSEVGGTAGAGLGAATGAILGGEVYH
ncbi:MAG: hypothetical protein JSS50_03500 [Proteobacteria bacterium]|nr:hypothetical protein [Pseudomonadota bacterium]